MLNKSVKLFLGMMFFGLVVFQGKTLAVDTCDGIYSPGNPYLCKPADSSIQGNCVWWTWHWLRYGKGDRAVTSSSSFRGSAYTWANKAVSLGYSVITTPTKNTVAVNETQMSGGELTGHVATVDEVTSTGIYVYEMNWRATGFRRRFYNNGYFTKFIVPNPQPVLQSIVPSPIYKANYDQNFYLNGENLDKVTKLEVTFPSGGTGTLSGSQILWKNYSQLSFLATFGTSGRYVVNAVTDKNVESIPQMPFDVQ